MSCAIYLAAAGGDGGETGQGETDGTGVGKRGNGAGMEGAGCGEKGEN